MLWVVKLGGSFWAADSLLSWLEVLAEGPVVVVPGGGVFADAVREAQQRWKFDNQLAHTLAISAMHQYGLMLQGLCPKLQTGTPANSLKTAIKKGKSVLWLPDAEQLAEQRIRASWDVTSDSLAAWLAEQLGAQHLLLIKSAHPPTGSVSITELIRAEWVDKAFLEMTGGCRYQIWLSGPEQHTQFMAGLAKPHAVFSPALCR